MNKVEKTGKTIEEAVTEALKVLKVPREETEVTVLEMPVKGFFGIGAKPARIIAEVKYDPAARAKGFVRELTALMGVSAQCEVTLNDKTMSINLYGENMGVLIGKRGQTLDSLQYLANLYINKGGESYISVSLDTENYRKRRRDTLEALALNIARKVKQTKRSVTLEPMNPYERRIIHSCLQPDKQITTYSEGEEPFRNVVIAYKR